MDEELVDYEDDIYDNIPEEGEELPPQAGDAGGDQNPDGSVLVQSTDPYDFLLSPQDVSSWMSSLGQP